MNTELTLPQLVVKVEGRSLSEDGLQYLGEVLVQQRLSLPTLCELRFFDYQGSREAFLAFAPGAQLEVRVLDHAEALFVGEVTATEHLYEPGNGRELRVRGYDLLHRLRKRQQVRAHVQVTLTDLANELVNEAGLVVSVKNTSSSPLWERLIQYGQSDFDFLTQQAEACGQYFTLRKDTLHLLTLSGIGEVEPLQLGENLFEARIEVNGEGACRSVSTTAWDPLLVEPHEGSAETARVGREVSAEAPPDRLGGMKEYRLVDEAIENERQAEALAQAELDSRVAHEVTFWGVTEGNPRLRPGTCVSAKGIEPTLAGRYILTEVTHTLDNRKGFVSEITSAPMALRPRSRAATTTFGVVTRVNDPKGFGRVKVSLPTCDDVETDWMGVVTAGAGSKKGMITLPDVGDKVLLLLPHGDLAQGVVLGGLYGSEKLPDKKAVDGEVIRRYTFLTPGKQRVYLDDADDVIRLENSKGSYLELSPKTVLLHAKTDLKIEAPGQSVRIRGKKIDFEKA